MSNNLIFNGNKSSIIANNPWFMLEEGFTPIREREVEAILSFGNGYWGTRNSLEEYYSISNPVTLIGGIYNKIAGSNRNELVKEPDWTRIQVFIEDNMLDLYNDRILSHKRYVDFKRGIVCREWRTQDSIGKITNIKIIKFISLSKKHEAFKRIIINPENYSGRIRVISGIDGGFTVYPFPIPEVPQSPEFIMMAMRVNELNTLAVMTQKSEFLRNNEKIFLSPFVRIPLSPFAKGEILYQQGYKNKMIYEEWEWIAEYETQYSINSIVTAFTSLDDKDPIKASREYISNFDSNYYKNGLISHINCWEKCWNNANIIICNDQQAQKWYNFAAYHLISAGKYSGNNKSIPARGLSGGSYQGHVFWDTEIYMLPFYIFTDPQIARALLIYRYNTLVGARENAKNEGYTGASYAWESTDSGLEMTPDVAVMPYGQIINIYSGKYEKHISPDIAYAVWQYWQVTHDEDFIVNYGSEIIFETAKYCESLLTLESDNYYHVYDIIGPDEYHERINDNSYTNLMIQYNFEIAAKISEFLAKNYNEAYEKLKLKINLENNEIQNWHNIKDRIYVAYNPKIMLYEQFYGYFNLEYINLKDYEPRNVPMDMILGRDKTSKTQIIKQADVVMFLFLLANKFSREIIEVNYDYYEPRTSHGSSLSPGVYSIVAARLGKMNLANKYFRQNAEVDLNDIMGSASGGIHMATMGNVWMSIIMGFAGLYIYDEGLLFNPHLPEHWEKLKFTLFWRKQKINIQLDKNEMIFEIIGNQKVNINIGFTNWRELDPDNTYSAYKVEKWYWK